MCDHDDYELSDHFAARAAQRFGLSDSAALSAFADEIVGAIRGESPRMIAFEGDHTDGKRRVYVRDKVGKRSFEVIASVYESDDVMTLVTVMPPRGAAKIRRNGRCFKRKTNGPRPATYEDYLRLFGKAPEGMEMTT